ncbi:MAG: MYG1 family protein [Verrucomicrobiota bacterium]|nr:MYG1 family protein [Verrucomicrobiota bacterium]
MRSFGTHDGSFHADEVTACSLLLLFGRVDRDKIFRTRDPEMLARCEYVCDVGGVYDPLRKRFDHHQAEYRGPLSSAGMVLLYLKENALIDSHLYDGLNKSLILGVDAHDNGVSKLEVGTASFSNVVSNFLPIEYDVTREEMDQAFFTAVDFVVGHLDRLKKRFAYTKACEALVRDKMKEGGQVLLFEESLPWMENFFELGGEVHPAQFVIMPAGKHWKLRGIPPSLNERMKVRKALPEAWAGLQDEELKKVSGISGAIFCHKGRFISIWETREDALKALYIALKR